MERPKTDSKSSHIGRVPLAPRDFGPQAGDGLMRMLLEDALTFPPKPWHLSDGENDGKRWKTYVKHGISWNFYGFDEFEGDFRWPLAFGQVMAYRRNVQRSPTFFVGAVTWPKVGVFLHFSSFLRNITCLDVQTWP